MHALNTMNIGVLRNLREVKSGSAMGRLSQLARFQRDRQKAEKRLIAARAAARLAKIRGMSEARMAMVKRVAETKKQRRTDAQQDKALKAHEAKIADIALTNKSHQEKIGKHTSELQSHSDLVCRLLLEKKKKTNKNK